MPNDEGLIDVKKYFFFSILTPQGPASGIAVNKNRLEMLSEFLAKGVTVIYLEDLTLEDYTMLLDRMKESASKPKLIVAHGNVPRQ